MKLELIDERDMLLYNAVEQFLSIGRMDLVEKHDLKKYIVNYNIDPTVQEHLEYDNLISNISFAEVVYDKKSEFPILSGDISYMQTYRNLIHRLCEHEEYEICESLKEIRDDVIETIVK
jgi:hypothetical protein